MTGTGKVRLILGGGGSAAQSRPVDERFAAWMGPGATLLYLPVALPDGSPMLAGCERWIHAVFDDLGVGRIVTLYAEEVLEARWNLDDVDGVYIGGGNTYLLLDLLRRSGMDTALRELARSGRPISGGSAGAVILGKDIGHSEALGDANDAGLDDTSSLDLLRDRDGNSWLVVPHYTEAWQRMTEALTGDTGTNVVCIAEDAGLIVEDGLWEVAGTGQVRTVIPA